MTENLEQLPTVDALGDNCSCLASEVSLVASSEPVPVVTAFGDDCLQTNGRSADIPMRIPKITEMKTSSDFLSLTAMDIPLKFLAERFTMWFYVPDECINLRKATIGYITNKTNTDISLTDERVGGFVKLIISGRIPDIYSAHLLVIWCVKEKLTGVEASIENTIAQLTAMQREHQQTMEAPQQNNHHEGELLRPKRRRISKHQGALESLLHDM